MRRLRLPQQRGKGRAERTPGGCGCSAGSRLHRGPDVIVLLPCLLGKFMWRAFCWGEEEEGSFPQKHPGICQKRDRKEKKKKKKGDREWERQGPLTNE